MKFADVAAMFKNGNDFSKKTGLAPGNFHNWKRYGYIPIQSQIRLEGILGGELKADCDDVPDQVSASLKKVFLETGFDALLAKGLLKKDWMELDKNTKLIKLNDMIRKLRSLKEG